MSAWSNKPAAVTEPPKVVAPVAKPTPKPEPKVETEAENEKTTTTTTPANLATYTTPPPQPPSDKPINCLVVDTGPLIKNDPPISTLLAKADELYTIPSVITEIRDEVTRARVESQLVPFLKLRNPKPESVKFVTEFARRTGDLDVLSRPDILLVALTYELECERNGGDWRLRKTPAQKGVNGKSPAAMAAEAAKEAEERGEAKEEEKETETKEEKKDDSIPSLEEKVEGLSLETTEATETAPIETAGTAEAEPEAKEEEAEEEAEEEEEEDDGEGEWITATNVRKHQAKTRGGVPDQPLNQRLQAALLTSDYAMQNVSLRINLNLLSPALARIKFVKTWVLRCHGCFAVTKQMDKQFCPSCGQATLTRTSCSVDSSGQFRLYLKKNFQWNKRGNVFSVPKPIHGSASGKLTDTSRGGGGHKGWGRDLILSEDQREYELQSSQKKREDARLKSIMDDDYLPSLLTGVRHGSNGQRIKVGAGRNVNARRRRQ